MPRCLQCNTAITRGEIKSIQCSTCLQLCHTNCAASISLSPSTISQCCASRVTLAITSPGLSSNADTFAPSSASSCIANPSSTSISSTSKRLASSPQITHIAKQHCYIINSCNTHSAADNTGNTPPTYFTQFLDEFRARDDRLNRYIEALSTGITALEETVDKNKEETTTELNIVEKELQSLSQGAALEDSCELRISSIPITVDLLLTKIALRVFNAIKLLPIEAHIVVSRKWESNRSNSFIQARSSTTSAATSATAAASSSSFSIAVLLASPLRRDMVLKKAGASENMDAKSIFGCGSNQKIYMNAFWPKDVYELWCKTLVATRK